MQKNTSLLDNPFLRHITFALIAFGLCLFTVFFFHSSLSSQYLWDDLFLMGHPFYLRMGFSLDAILGPVLTNPALFWRPLGMLTIALQWDLSLNALDAKWVNLYLLCAIVIAFSSLLYLEGSRLIQMRFLSFLKNRYEYLFILIIVFTLLLITLPSTSASVSFIHARFALLATFFILCSFLLLRHGPKLLALWLAPLLYFCALLSIETALAALPLLLLVVIQKGSFEKAQKHLESLTVSKSPSAHVDPMDLSFKDFLLYQLNIHAQRYTIILFVFITALYVGLRLYFLGHLFPIDAPHYPSFFTILSASWHFLSTGFSHYTILFPGQPSSNTLLTVVGIAFFIFIIASLRLHQKHLFSLSAHIHAHLSQAQKSSATHIPLPSLFSTNAVENRYFLALKLQALYTVHSALFIFALLACIIISSALIHLWAVPGTTIFFASDAYLFLPYVYLLGFYALFFLLDSRALHADATVVQGASDKSKKHVIYWTCFIGTLCVGIGLFIFGLLNSQQYQKAWSSNVALWQSSFNASSQQQPNILAHMNLMVALHKSKAPFERIETVGEALWQSISKHPQPARHELAAVATYGALLAEYGHPEKATAILTLLTPKSAAEPLVALNLAHAAMASNKPIEALGALDFALNHYGKAWNNPRQASVMYALRAKLYANLNDTEKSQADLKRSNDILRALNERANAP